MTKMISITNCETGEEIVREMTDEELQNIETMKIAALKVESEHQAKIEAKKLIFSRLGLSDEEAAVLFG